MLALLLPDAGSRRPRSRSGRAGANMNGGVTDMIREALASSAFDRKQEILKERI